MPEIAAEKKGSRNPEVPADIVILFVLMKMIYLLQREEQLEFHTYIKERIGFILRMEI